MTDTIDQGARPDAGDGDDEPPFKVLTPAEAQALRERHPPLSPWRIVAAQAVAGVLIALLALAVTGKGAAGWSALYGAAAVVLPQAVMARGLGRLSRLQPAAAVMGFMVWELVKMFLAAALLAAAVMVVPDLHWPALLVGLVGCLKAHWLVLLRQGRRRN